MAECNDCGSGGKIVKYDSAPGAQGYNGWTPELALAADGTRIVEQVVDWFGGTGTKPEVGVYVSATGFISDITQGVDVRGPQGLVGPAGPAGPAGGAGPVGVGIGIPTGGITSQVLRKKSNTNYDTEWGNEYKVTATTASGIDVASDASLISQTFTVVASAGTLAYESGVRILARDAANDANFVSGIVTGYSGTSLVVLVDRKGGTGVISNWEINLGDTAEYAGTTIYNGITDKDIVIKNTKDALDYLLKPLTPWTSNFHKGGHHNDYDTFTEINAIPAELQKPGMYAIQNPSFSALQTYTVAASYNSAGINLIDGKLFIFSNRAVVDCRIYVVDPITLANVVAPITIPSSTGISRFAASYEGKLYFIYQVSGGYRLNYLTTDTYTFGTAIALNEDAVYPIVVNGVLYIAQRTTNIISYVDLRITFPASATTISVSAQPFTFGYNPVNDRLFIFPFDSNVIRYLDGASTSPSLSGTTITIPGSTTSRAYCTGVLLGDFLYFTSNGNVSPALNFHKLNTTGTPAITSGITVGTGPIDSIYANKKIFVANNGSSSVTVLDSESFTITTTITVGTQPCQAGSMIKNANYIIVPCNGNKISVIDIPTSVNVKDFITSGPNRQLVFDVSSSNIFSSSTGQSVSRFSFSGIKEYTLVKSDTGNSFVETTSPRLSGDSLKGQYYYEKDFSSDISGLAIPHVDYVNTLIALKIIQVEVNISSALLLASNTTPITIITTPGASKAIDIISASASITFNSAAYGTNTTLELITNTATQPQMNCASVLNATVSRTLKFNEVAPTGATDTQVISNQAVKLRTASGNPIAGNSSVKLYISYRIINL